MNAKEIRLVVAIGLGLAAAASHCAPLIGKAVGEAVERAVAREVAEATAKQSLETGAGRTMSSALASVTAKQLMGAGVGTGVAVAVPIAAFKLSDGQQEVDKARAEAIRKTSEAAVREIPKHPELVRQTIEAVDGGEGSPLARIGRWFDRALPWLCGVVGLGCLLYLAGFLLRALAYVRRGFAARTVVPQPVSEPAIIDITSTNN